MQKVEGVWPAQTNHLGGNRAFVKLGTWSFSIVLFLIIVTVVVFIVILIVGVTMVVVVIIAMSDVVVSASIHRLTHCYTYYQYTQCCCYPLHLSP